MIYLIGSIILTAYLILAFKGLEKMRLNTFQAIVFNYITCMLTGALFDGSFPINANNIQSNWFPWACLSGSLFIITFNLAAITTQRISVAVASVSYRLSLIIPVIFSVYLYSESIGALQWTGILLALAAVVITCWPNKRTEAKNTTNHALLFVLPTILFFGSGLMDALIKYVEQAYLNDANKNAFLGSAFGAAATIGLIFLVVQVIRGKQKIAARNIIAGIVIGIPNYLSIWCLIKSFQVSAWQSSQIIPINNMGVVLVSTVTAWILFKETISKINWIGICLSTVAILLIAFGDKI